MSSSSNCRYELIDLSLCWLTVIDKPFWEAIQAILKLAEFRSPRQKITFVPAMHLLFSLGAAERRVTELLATAVLEIVTLTQAEAYARFQRKAEGGNLLSRCKRWNTNRVQVQCFVLYPRRIGVAHDLVKLSVGNLGILRQFRDSDGKARFCRRLAPCRVLSRQPAAPRDGDELVHGVWIAQ